MKTISIHDLAKLQSKLERLQSQYDSIRRFTENKLGTDLHSAAEFFNYDNEVIGALLSIDGSIECALENLYNI